MPPINLHNDFFTLFGLDKRFRLDQSMLDDAYLALQTHYHPDRAAHLDPAAKQPYLDAATHINQAYRTLKSPASRARYLLDLAGIDTQEESNTAVPNDFLMSQMQWRENIEEAHTESNIEALENLHHTLRSEMNALDSMLELALDQQGDMEQAALLVRQYRFYEKLDEEMGNAIESLLF